jgi:hypothetical protein
MSPLPRFHDQVRGFPADGAQFEWIIHGTGIAPNPETVRVDQGFESTAKIA